MRVPVVPRCYSERARVRAYPAAAPVDPRCAMSALRAGQDTRTDWPPGALDLDCLLAAGCVASTLDGLMEEGSATLY